MTFYHMTVLVRWPYAYFFVIVISTLFRCFRSAACYLYWPVLNDYWESMNQTMIVIHCGCFHSLCSLCRYSLVNYIILTYVALLLPNSIAVSIFCVIYCSLKQSIVTTFHYCQLNILMYHSLKGTPAGRAQWMFWYIIHWKEPQLAEAQLCRLSPFDAHTVALKPVMGK